MEENDYKSNKINKIVIAHKYSYFPITMLLCGLLSFGLLFGSAMLYLNPIDESTKNVQPIIMLIFACLVFAIPFIVLTFDKKRPNEVISYDITNKILYVYSAIDRKIELARIPINRINDVKKIENYERRSSYEQRNGKITFILNNGNIIHSLYIDDVDEAWQMLTKIVIKNNR